MNHAQFWGGAAVPYSIDRSLRFNRADNAYLSFTPSSAGNQRTWTWSVWIKRSQLEKNTDGQRLHYLFSPVRGGDGFNESFIRFNNDDTLQVHDSGGQRGKLITTRKFRDVSAWYHIVVALDTTQSTASDRVKVYVNGEQETDFSTETYPSQNTTWGWNDDQRHDLGRYGLYEYEWFSGYMAEVNFIEGSALAASDFGETDSATGTWIPKNYTGSYGTLGWYLDFSDNSNTTAATLGADSSGNSNDWTPNNFSVTAGTDNDSMEDTPTNNWCTLNPLNKGIDSLTVNEGNLRYSTSGTDLLVVASMALPSSGQWYWEYKKISSFLMVGIICDPENNNRSTYLGGQPDGYSVYAYNGIAYNNGSGSTYMASSAANSIVTVAYDADNRRMYVGTNGNWADGSGNTDETFANAAIAHTIPTGKTCYPAISVSSGSAYINFGQRPFDYTPPSGYKALNSENLPEPTVKKGTEYFNTVVYEGNSTTNSITGVGFQPDLVWIKQRNAAENHFLTDAVRGAGIHLRSDTTLSENDDSATFTAFTSDGFSLTGTGPAEPQINDDTDTYVAWNWKANGSGSANTDGTIDSTVSVNADAGFSIVSFEGTGSDGSVGHGLGVTPSVVIFKNRDVDTTNWSVQSPLFGNRVELNLNNSGDDSTDSRLGDSDNWSSTIFKVNTYDDQNKSGDEIIAYCFAEVEGYSKFGTYTGNGSSTDGVYIYLGFKPAFVMFKGISVASNWCILDSTRDTFNLTESTMQANETAQESTTLSDCDFLSNGIKMRSVVSNDTNVSGQTYLYMAFAEVPFKHANAV